MGETKVNEASSTSENNAIATDLNESERVNLVETNANSDDQKASQPPNQDAKVEGWGELGTNLDDKVIRIKFIRKVYLIVTAQLLFTFGVCLMFTVVDFIQKWVTESTGGFVLYILS